MGTRETIDSEARVGSNKGSDVTNLSQSLVFLCRVIQIRGLRDFFQENSTGKISPGAYAAMRLIEANPGIRLGSMAAILEIQESNMTKLAKELTAAKLVTRQKSPTDGRSSGLRLTEAGKSALAKTYKRVGRVDRRLAASLSDAEYKSLLTLLRKIYTSALPPGSFL